MLRSVDAARLAGSAKVSTDETPRDGGLSHAATAHQDQLHLVERAVLARGIVEVVLERDREHPVGGRGALALGDIFAEQRRRQVEGGVVLQPEPAELVPANRLGQLVEPIVTQVELLQRRRGQR